MESARSERNQQKLRSSYETKDKEVKSSIRADKRVWLENQVSMAQKAADNGHMKTLYGITKNICNDKRHSSTAIKDMDNNVITEEDKRLERWKEHFEEVLKREPPENPIATTNQPPLETKSISTEPVSVVEVRLGTMSVKGGKVGGADNIVAELLK